MSLKWVDGVVEEVNECERKFSICEKRLQSVGKEKGAEYLGAKADEEIEPRGRVKVRRFNALIAKWEQ